MPAPPDPPRPRRQPVLLDRRELDLRLGAVWMVVDQNKAVALDDGPRAHTRARRHTRGVGDRHACTAHAEAPAVEGALKRVSDDAAVTEVRPEVGTVRVQKRGDPV